MKGYRDLTAPLRGPVSARKLLDTITPSETQPDDPDFVNVKNVPLSIDALGMTTTFVQDRKKEGRWTKYRSRYDVDLLDPDGISAKSGIRTGDSIVYFNHETFLDEAGLRANFARVPAGGSALLGVRPRGENKNVSFQVIKAGGSGTAGRMVPIIRSPAELASLMAEDTFDPRAAGIRKLQPADLADYLNKTLYLQNRPFKTLLEIYFSDNGVAGMKYNVGAFPKKTCGKWWIQESKLCWGVLGARAEPVCYEPLMDSRKTLILADYESGEPERYELTRATAGDPLGYGAGSRRAFDEYLQISAREDRRLRQFAEAHDVCEQERSVAIAERGRGVRAAALPSSVYDECMGKEGFPMGLFSALSQRTVISTFETLVTGQSSMGQCTF